MVFVMYVIDLKRYIIIDVIYCLGYDVELLKFKYGCILQNVWYDFLMIFYNDGLLYFLGNLDINYE